MLRPATPLSILLAISFGLLLISVLSTPIITSIPLGSFDGVTFGVFGFCRPEGCTPIEIGYNTGSLGYTDAQEATFDLPVAARNTLSGILVVHPIAALLTLIMLVLAVVSHWHSPSHSARYLLILFIVGIVDMLVCLLAFLIDVLLFVPHMAWGSYLVLGATIGVALSGLISCAMRRTVVSRKTRKKRIAENAEMSGENYYNRQAAEATTAVTAVSLQPTVPVMAGGAAGGGDKLPEFATFEKRDDNRSSDEQIPLTARSPSDRSPNNPHTDLAAADPYGRAGPVQRDQYGNPIGPLPGSSSGGVVERDQYGNPLPPVERDQYGNPMPVDAYGAVRRGPSFERINSRGRGGMPPPGYRGRGGGPGGPYGGRGGYGPGGGYDPYGGGRGGYSGPQGRGGGGYGGRGGYGPPPPRGGGSMRGGRGPPPGYGNAPPPGPYGPGGRRPSPGGDGGYGYGGQGQGYSSSMPSVSTGGGSGGYDAYNPDRASLPRAESPPPMPGLGGGGGGSAVGQAIEMDATTGSPSHQPRGFGQFPALRESDADVAGMIGLQQARTSGAGGGNHDTFVSESSKYSGEDQYVPPRQGWNGQQQPAVGRSSPRVPSPLNIPSSRSGGGPAELPTSRGYGSTTPTNPSAPAAAAANTGGGYYEDIDPRFAAQASDSRTTTPKAPAHHQQQLRVYDDDAMTNNSGARSPADSDRSNFTSISQRGVNPRWNGAPQPPPPMPTAYGGGSLSRRPVPGRGVLDSNPDFQVAGQGRGPPPRGGPGMVPQSAYPTAGM